MNCDLCPVAVLRVDDKGRILSSNKAFHSLWGFPPRKELRGISLFSLFKNTGEIRGMWEEIDTGGKWKGPVEGIRNDGKEIQTILAAHSIEKKNGEDTVIINIFDPEEYPQNNQFFADLVSCSNDWIGETDKDGRYTYVSENVREYLGFSHHELIGRYVIDTVIDKDRPLIEEKLIGQVNNPPPMERYIKRVKTADNKVKVMETTFVPIKNTRGEFTGFRGINRDITKPVGLYRELKRKNKELKEMNNALRLILDLKTEQQALGDKSVFAVKKIFLPLLEDLEKNGTDKQLSVIKIMKDLLLSIKTVPEEASSLLSEKELKVALYIVNGHTSKEISDLMCLSVRTVENYRQSIRKKIGVKSSSENLQEILVEFFKNGAT